MIITHMAASDKARLRDEKEGSLVDLERAFEYIGKSVELGMKEAHIPGCAMAITDRERVLKVFTYGFGDISSQAKITPNTLFEVGSIGKSFTCLALLQLSDEGKLDLNAPVAQYLPWFQVISEYQPITVDHLMNHTAGIIRGTDMAPYGLYDSWALRETRTSAPPGKFWHYSSVGYKTLGFVLEQVTGQPYEDVIQSRVLDRLGMTQTYAAVTYETREKTATGYCCYYDDRPEHPSYPIVPANWTEFGTGDGCIVSTVGDLAIYLRMLLNRGRGPEGRLISEESFELLTEPEIAVGSENYGYGLAIYPVDGHIYIGHGGGTAGFMSAIVVDTEDGLGVAALANKMGETDAVVASVHHALTLLRTAYHDRPLPPVSAPADPRSIQNAGDYAGAYRSGDTVIHLTAADGNLLLEYGGGTVVLERRAPDSFYAPHPDFELFLLEFIRDHGQVVEAWHGSDWYTNQHYSGPQHFEYPVEWESYCGHYRARNPELSNFRVVLRKGVLILIRPSGNWEPLVPLGDGGFRIGGNSLSPETLRFGTVIEGGVLRADYSGCPYYRTFTP